MKDLIPIASGNAEILGLTKNEWIIQSYIFMIYMVIIVQLYGFVMLPVGIVVHLLVLFVVVTLFKNIEHNVFQVLLKAHKIDNEIIGTTDQIFSDELIGNTEDEA